MIRCGVLSQKPRFAVTNFFNDRWSVLGYAALVVSLISTGCRQSPAVPQKTALPTADASTAFLPEISETVGIRFQHATGDLHAFSMPQIMGSGGAMFDFDADGDLDIFLVDGGTIPESAAATEPESHWAGKLYRQEDPGHFVDVTEASGLTHRGYGMGCAVGDIDNDGDLDLYLTTYGEDRLFSNQGNGTFTDITDQSGISNPRWGTAASFFDYDLDGWLDLFVVNYLDYFPGSICEDGRGRRDYCGPQSFSGTVDKLYRNLGRDVESGAVRFSDETVARGLAARAGRGLGVLCRDFDGDRRPDVFVANDMQENILWMQQPDGNFRDEALLRGVAVNRLGEPEANMGVISDDLNRDGFFDLFVTHLTGETNTLFSGDPSGVFSDTTARSGLGAPSFPFTGFGVAAVDLQHDGHLDVVVVNGKVKRGPSTVAGGSANDHWYDYAEPNQVYLNDGRGQFVVEDRLGESRFSSLLEVSRGLISGDIDNDGDIDLLVTNCGGVARLFRNDFPKQGHWLGVRAVDPELRRDALGARITVRAGDLVMTRELNPSSSYLSSNDPRVHFGLGAADHYDSVEVEWPHGEPVRELFPGGSADRYLTLGRKAGKPMSGDPAP